MQGDFFSEFLSSADSLPRGNEVDLTLRPLFPSLRAFREEIVERVLKGGVRWCRGEEGERGCGSGAGNQGSPVVVYTVKMEWEYAVVKASELTEKQVRDGWTDSL